MFYINEGDNFQINTTNIIFDKIETFNENNFQALRAKFNVILSDKTIRSVNAGKNYYPVSKMITTEAGILHQWDKDIYFILGEQTDNQWLVKVYINPFVSFIWLGVVIMLYSGLIGVIRK